MAPITSAVHHLKTSRRVLILQQPNVTAHYWDTSNKRQRYITCEACYRILTCVLFVRCMSWVLTEAVRARAGPLAERRNLGIRDTRRWLLGIFSTGLIPPSFRATSPIAVIWQILVSPPPTALTYHQPPSSLSTPGYRVHFWEQWRMGFNSSSTLWHAFSSGGCGSPRPGG